MRIEIKTTGDDKIICAACNEECGLVAIGTGAKLDEAARDLVSKFAQYQKETIEALSASGIIRHVASETLS